MPTLLTFFRFSTVGGCSTLLHALLAWVLLVKFGLSIVISNVLAFCLATIFAFLANTCWSFARRPNFEYFMRYGFVATVCLFTTLFASLLAEWLALSPVFSIAIVICCVTPLGFFLHNKITYAVSAAEKTEAI